MDTKGEILSRLYAGETKGETLARELGITRAAVWKAVKQLAADGYDISASRRGYRLEGGDIISEAGIGNFLRTPWRVELHRELASTNDRAKALAESGADGIAVIADSQTNGRGRLGRSFFSPSGGLYMSVVVRPEMDASECGRITAYAAVAAARAVESLCGAEVKIKWVNDLYVGGKKICGILTEGGFGMESGELSYAVVGIGINAAGREFPLEIADRATSIENECGAPPDRCRLAAAVLDGLYALRTGELGGFIEEYRARSCVVGRRVVVNGEYEATAVGIGDDCSLLLDRGGETMRFSAGEVSLKL